MREYGQVSPRFWTGATGRKLRGHQEAQLIALYLMTCPGSHMIGIYPLALPTLCHEIGLSLEGASKGLRRLSEEGFAVYDDAEEVVWVPEMAGFQIAKRLTANDNRVKMVERELENYRKCRFFNAFLDKYSEAFSLKTRREPEPLPRDSEGAPKPLGSQEQEQEQDQEQEQKHQATAAAAPGRSLVLAPLGPEREESDDSKSTAEDEAAIAKLEADWDPKLVTAVHDALRATRTSGRMSSGPWLGFLRRASQYSRPRREAAAQAYLDRACAAQGKAEAYLVGMMANGAGIEAPRQPSLITARPGAGPPRAGGIVPANTRDEHLAEAAAEAARRRT